MTVGVLLPFVMAACSDSSDTVGDGSDVSRVVVRDDRSGRPIDRRVFGSNLPAWLGPDLLADPAFVSAVQRAGVTVVRMPGGSWSNSYSWSACENADETSCWWPWAARPTDFVDFMQASRVPGMWTVSINETAQSAAAAVAFFNGAVGDQRPIGVDRNGVDWATVDTWASLRASHGNPEPAPIALWEVGNEVFAGRPDAGGSECVSFGWEDVWTCDGAAYVDGDDEHDGYLAIRAAMRAVDPSIEVGAVGVADPASWSDWGEEVIGSAGADLDFYTVHQYGFDSPPDVDDVLGRPAELWPGVIDSVGSALPDAVPIAITEYNLVSSLGADPEHVMTHAANALFIADTIGQLVTEGVPIANQWNVANGSTEADTDYGLIDAADLSAFPQFHAMEMWTKTGTTLLDVDGPDDAVHVYPTRREDGTMAIVVINLDGRERQVELELATGTATASATLNSMRAGELDDDELIQEPVIAVVARANGSFDLSLPAWSMSLLEADLDG